MTIDRVSSSEHTTGAMGLTGHERMSQFSTRSPGVAVAVSDSPGGQAPGETSQPLATNQPMPAPAEEPKQTFRSRSHINARNRSTVVDELALRPGFSAQARKPPTAWFCRHEARGGGYWF
jgi:hypothetical protein